jgi:NAD(P)H-dependent FMN reductase
LNALILVGSPKGRVSASWMLGSRLAEGLRDHGVTVQYGMVHHELRSGEGTAQLLDLFDSSDLVVLAFPLYVDSLPAPLTRLLELVAERRGRTSAPGTPRLAVVVQCGFPEAHQCDTAIGICRRFAGSAGMGWAGALAMGMGGSLEGDFRRLPGGGKQILDALGMTAEALARGGDIPNEAKAAFARPLMPRWLYILTGNLGWRLKMRKNKARRPIGDRPYAQG